MTFAQKYITMIGGKLGRLGSVKPVYHQQAISSVEPLADMKEIIECFGVSIVSTSVEVLLEDSISRLITTI